MFDDGVSAVLYSVCLGYCRHYSGSERLSYMQVKAFAKGFRKVKIGSEMIIRAGSANG
jgi:hypothetical protein